MVDSPAKRSPRAGQIIRGTYRLGRLIGRGGMGEVYEAEHVSIARRFAVKLLVGEYAEDAEALGRFHREANIAASLGSAHIVEVFDFNFAEDGSPFMAMELLAGETLCDRLRRCGAMAPEAWLPLFSQVCDGLDAAHGAGIVHRDLKPENLFLARDRRGEEILKILDFGISKIRSSDTLKTRAGTVLGTPNYMPPEQAEGSTAEADARADIFSLGAIVYEVVSGRLAFPGPTLPAVILKICYQDPEPLALVAPQVPVAVVAAIDRALSKAPSDRFPDVRSFLDAYRLGLAPRAADRVPPALASAAFPAARAPDGAPASQPRSRPRSRPALAQSTGPASMTVSSPAGLAQVQPGAAPSSSVPHPTALTAPSPTPESSRGDVQTTLSLATSELGVEEAFALPRRRARGLLVGAGVASAAVLAVVAVAFLGLRQSRPADEQRRPGSGVSPDAASTSGTRTVVTDAAVSAVPLVPDAAPPSLPDATQAGAAGRPGVPINRRTPRREPRPGERQMAPDRSATPSPGRLRPSPDAGAEPAVKAALREYDSSAHRPAPRRTPAVRAASPPRRPSSPGRDPRPRPSPPPPPRRGGMDWAR